MRKVRYMKTVQDMNDTISDGEELKKARSKFKKLGRHTLKPYEGRDELPRCDESRMFKMSDSRYFCNGNNTAGYKLIRVYRDKTNQIKRSRVITLKPNKKGNVRDRDILVLLKEAKIPGIIG